MRILDALLKNMTPAQKGGALIKTSETTEKKTSVQPEASTESSRILADLKSQGYAVSSEEADRISEFIESTEGPESEKLQTVKTALDKGIPLSARGLQSVRFSLFKPVFPEELQQVLADSQSDIPVDQVELLRFFAKMAGKDQSESLLPALLNSTGENAFAGSGVTPAGAENDVTAVGEDQVVTWLLKALEQVTFLGDSLATAEEGVRQVLPLQTGQPPAKIDEASMQEGHAVPISSETERTDSAASGEAVFSEPRETQAPEETSESVISAAADQLLSAVQELAHASPEASAEVMMQGISLLMKEITPRMAAVKTEFESLRKALTTELAAVRLAIERPQSVNKTQVAEQLTQTIERLDKAILKSDIPLYTSMQAEKQLLSWSSQLQEARSLVQEGQSGKAAEIVDRIAKGVEEIRFQPAKVKVIHRTLQQAVSGDDISEKSLRQRAQQQVNRVLEPVHSSREVLEAFKAMGLTHESEVVSALGQNSKKAKEDWRPQENLKEILMQLAADTDEKLTTVTGAEKTLNNLTGQQLLSRPEAKPQGQTLFFSVPMAMANRVEDLKIYVQSRKDKGKVDWENCTFYFAVHTEKYGDVGIRFAAARKSVSIQVKCDNQTLRDAVGPLVADFKQTMWETGYKIAGISYSPLKDSKVAAPKAEEGTEAEMEGKGLNLKV